MTVEQIKFGIDLLSGILVFLLMEWGMVRIGIGFRSIYVWR